MHGFGESELKKTCKINIETPRGFTKVELIVLTFRLCRKIGYALKHVLHVELYLHSSVVINIETLFKFYGLHVENHIRVVIVLTLKLF